jgi:hypothetical protein
MDNDNKIIKSPYYSLNDLKEYSELLTRGLNDINFIEEESAIANFILHLQQSSNIRRDMFLDIWKRFEGKEDSDDILEEKAIVLSAFMTMAACVNTDVFYKICFRKNLVKPSIGSAEVFTEIVSVYFCFMVAFFDSRKSFDEKNKVLILGTLARGLSYVVPEKGSKELASDLAKRIKVYSLMPYYVKEDGLKYSRPGTILWELANNIRSRFNRLENPSFTEMVISTILADVDSFQLEKLFI